jgi:hypothetical protein
VNLLIRDVLDPSLPRSSSVHENNNNNSRFASIDNSGDVTTNTKPRGFMRIERWVESKPEWTDSRERCMACGKGHTIENCNSNYRCQYDGSKTHRIREVCSHPSCIQPKAKLDEYLEHIRAYNMGPSNVL